MAKTIHNKIKKRKKIKSRSKLRNKSNTQKRGKGTKQDFRRRIVSIKRDARRHDPPLPTELTDQIVNELSKSTIKDYESKHRSSRQSAKNNKKFMFMAQLDMLDQDDGVYNPNNENVANAMNKAYRIFSARDLQNYPGLKDFSRMIFYGLRFMGNQGGENTAEYKKTKQFFIKFLNNIFNKNIDERISDDELVSDQILNGLY